MQGWTMSNTAIRSMRLKKKMLTLWLMGRINFTTQKIMNCSSWSSVPMLLLPGQQYLMSRPLMTQLLCILHFLCIRETISQHQPPRVFSGDKNNKICKTSQRIMLEWKLPTLTCMYLGDMKGKSTPNNELFWKPRIMSCRVWAWLNWLHPKSCCFYKMKKIKWPRNVMPNSQIWVGMDITAAACIPTVHLLGSQIRNYINLGLQT